MAQRAQITQERVVQLYDPATEKSSVRVPVADRHQVDEAVLAARQCFDAGWGVQPINARLALLEGLHRALDERRDALALAISQEIGTPIDNARTQQVQTAISHLEATIKALSDATEDYPVRPGERHHRVRYEAMGVAALITPWNWPLNQVVLKVSAALASGCTMVLKPSELTPKTAALFQECMDMLNLPDGVFSIVKGDGATGQHLVRNHDVDVISFTGSTRVGREIAAIAAQKFKPVILELGGKSPNLLFADCDLKTAVKQGVAHCFRNSGQSCNAASRMLVEQSVYDEAVELAARFAHATRVDLPSKRGRHIGPLINAEQFERVQTLIEAGLRRGARLVAGGLGRAAGFETGYFPRPTVFADVTPDMQIARAEIFGPVLVMTPFKDEEEAIRLANDTDYGLAAYIQTSDLARADRVSQKLHAGMVQVNGSSRAPGAAFGGIKASGMGREAGIWGIRAFQHVKSISGAPLQPDF